MGYCVISCAFMESLYMRLGVAAFVFMLGVLALVSCAAVPYIRAYFSVGRPSMFPETLFISTVDDEGKRRQRGFSRVGVRCSVDRLCFLSFVLRCFRL